MKIIDRLHYRFSSSAISMIGAIFYCSMVSANPLAYGPYLYEDEQGVVYSLLVWYNEICLETIEDPVFGTICIEGKELVAVYTFDANGGYVSSPDVTSSQMQDINRETEELFASKNVTYLQQLSQPTFSYNCHGWSLPFSLWIDGFYAKLYYAHYFESTNSFEESTNAIHDPTLFDIDHSSTTKVLYYTIPEGCEGAGQMFPANTYNGKYGEAGRYLSGYDLPEAVYGEPTIWLKRSS